MSPNPPVARKKLNYPLYGVDFDPNNHDFLIVGGGGGSTSSGVPNKITLLAVSRFTELREIVDIELAKNEDSVTSLAVADSDETSLLAYAGINGSIEDQDAGRNEHFRSFKIGLPTRKRKADEEEKSQKDISSSQSTTTALSRSAIFRASNGPKNETYQRVLRISPPRDDGQSRIAAIASGLAPQNEVVTMKATASPGQKDVISRISLEREANDLDMVLLEDEKKTQMLAYCTDREVYIQRILSSGQGTKEPIKIHDSEKISPGSKIRALRWLTPRYMVLLRNRSGRSGADVVVLKTDKDYTAAQLVLVKRLQKSTKQAVGLDICAPTKSSSADQQFVIAVAAQDSSIEILTLNYSQTAGMDKFKQYMYSVNIHAGPITRVVFSHFTPPQYPTSKDTKPQYIRLATVGVDQVVSVITFPLRPYPATSKNPRYVLTPPPEALQNAVNISVALIVVIITAICMQIFCEVRGAVPSVLGATNWLSPTWQERIARPYNFANVPVIPESMPPVIQTAASSISSASNNIYTAVPDAVQAAMDAAASSGNSLLEHLVSSSEASNKAIIIRDSETSIDTEVHDHDSDPVKAETVKKWEELSEEQKKGWKRKLVKAGHWTEKQGESILKGILFSELGGLVGAIARG